MMRVPGRCRSRWTCGRWRVRADLNEAQSGAVSRRSRCRISTRSIRSPAICCGTPAMPTTPCRNATCAPFGISRRSAAGRSSPGCWRSCAMSAVPNMAPGGSGRHREMRRRGGCARAAVVRRRRFAGNGDAAPARRRDAAAPDRRCPSRFRETLVLRDISDLDYRDIADRRRRADGTVMSRLARARSMLRRPGLRPRRKGDPDDVRRRGGSPACADRRRARCRPCPRGRGACRRLSPLRPQLGVS